MIRDKENELYELDQQSEMKKSKTSNFLTMSKEEQTYNTLKSQLE